MFIHLKVQIWLAGHLLANKMGQERVGAASEIAHVYPKQPFVLRMIRLPTKFLTVWPVHHFIVVEDIFFVNGRKSMGMGIVSRLISFSTISQVECRITSIVRSADDNNDLFIFRKICQYFTAPCSYTALKNVPAVASAFFDGFCDLFPTSV